MSLSDLAADGLQELAGYLKRFPSDDDDAEQYWYQLACTLREHHRKKCDYSEQFLIAVGQREDKSALTFLKDLSKRGIGLKELVDCLKIIKCQPALNFFLQGATTPVITQPAKEQHRRLKVGETLYLNVEAECSPGTIEYCWFHGQRPLVQRNSNQLILTNITTAHRGTYHCKVTNPRINAPTVASAVSKPIHVEVDEEAPSNGIHRQETTHRSPPPLIIQHPKDLRVRIGQQESSLLTCKAEQSVLYDWYKDGRVFAKGNRTGLLDLSPVSEAALGEYYCVVVNDGGSETSNRVKVTMISDIEINHCWPLSHKCRVGELLQLTCTATSASGHRMNYEWLHLDSQNQVLECVGDREACSVTISSKNLRSDMTLHFRCKVTDSEDCCNFAYSNAFNVEVQTVWIVDQPRDVVAELKQRAQLTCVGGGEGTLTYLWLKSSTRNGLYNFYKRTALGVLPFDRLSMDDGGYYRCQVVSKMEHVDSDVVQVTPRLAHAVKDGVPAPSIKVLREPRSHVVVEGKPFCLKFEVVCGCMEELSYQWFFSGTKINGAISHAYVREKTSADDCGSYWCEVRAGSSCVVLSQPARIELKHGEAVPTISSWEQREGEQFFRTMSEERFAREKIALLIGNQAYEKEGLRNLNTPKNDIEAVQAVLSQPLFDFKVFSLLDLTHAEMQATLDMFYSLLKVSGTYALFYFSGHGFSTTRGNNFLVPVDSPPDSDSCFEVDSIINKMQLKFSRAILFLDACKVKKEMVHSAQDTSYASIGNQANVFEEWSCVDSTSAYDSLKSSASHFNSAFIKAINKKKKLSEIHDAILADMIQRSPQRPQSRGSLADSLITLQDQIMIDDTDLQDDLNLIEKEYCSARCVPEPVVFREDQMKELNMFAELKLSFTLILTNVLSVQVELRQVHGDKTSSASVIFDEQFLSDQGVSCLKCRHPIDGQDEGLCARTSLQVRGLQKLKSPLKLLMNVCLWESGQERCANITYTFKELPFIALKCS